MYCRRCGARTEERGDHPWCPACARPDWRNPSPAVGVAIRRQREVLLSKRAADPRQGWWDLVGGFLEPGESAEDGLRREVREETGLEIDELQLIAVEPGEYDGQPTLNLLYTAKAAGTPVPSDDSEELRWWPLDALPEKLAWAHEAAMLRSLAGH